MLYGNFTLKEWLESQFVTSEIEELFQQALSRNDEPMTVLALAELVKRGDSDIAAQAINDATNAGSIILGTRFAIVLANALMRCGNRNSDLREVSKSIQEKDAQRRTAAELLEGTNFADLQKQAPVTSIATVI